MTPFPLKIVTPDGLLFDGNAEELIVRTVTGDMAFLARHINCVVPLGMGRATIVSDGEKKYAATESVQSAATTAFKMSASVLLGAFFILSI